MKEDNIQYVAELFGKLCNNIAVKCAATASMVVSNFFIDGLLAKAIIAVFCMVIADWCTGVLAASKTGDAIKSSKIIRTPIKIAIYFMLISCARMAEYSLPESIRYLDNTVVAFLALTELISIFENTAKMGYAIPKKLLKLLQGLRDEK